VVGAAEVVGADPTGADREVLGNIGEAVGSTPGSAGVLAADVADAARFVSEPTRDAVEPGAQLGADDIAEITAETARRRGSVDPVLRGADAAISGADRSLDIDFDRRSRGEGAAIQATDDPEVRNQLAANLAVTAGSATVGTAASSAAVRAAEIATAGARVRAAGRGGPDINIDETTTQPEQVAAGDQPTFETPTDVDAEVAADEFRERAQQAPDELQEAAGGEQVTFRSEAERLPDDVEARSGNFELPGLFTSGDFAPLRFDDSGGGGMFSQPEVRTPEFFAEPERASAFGTPDVDTIPEGRAGSGFALQRTDTGDVVETDVPQGEAARRADSDEPVERIPDPTEPGVQFLEEEATPGTAFVRPSGDRTPEFEGVFPPGTRFNRVETGTITARSGETATLDVFRPADRQAVADGSGGTRGVTLQEISQRQGSSGGGVPDSTPIVPPPPPGGASAGSGSGPASNTETPSSTPLGSVGSSSPAGSTGGGGGGSTGGGGGGSAGGSGGGSSAPSSPLVTEDLSTTVPTVTPSSASTAPSPTSSTPTISDPSGSVSSGGSSGTPSTTSGVTSTATSTTGRSGSPPPELPEFDFNSDEDTVDADFGVVEEDFENPARGVGVVDDEITDDLGGVGDAFEFDT
jgi:hypothetical protein